MNIKIPLERLSVPFSFLKDVIHLDARVLHYAQNKKIHTLGDFMQMDINDISGKTLYNDVRFFQNYIIEKSNTIYREYKRQNIHAKIQKIKLDSVTHLNETSCPRLLCQKLYKSGITTLEQVKCLNTFDFQFLGFSFTEIKEIYGVLENPNKIKDEEYLNKYPDNILQYSNYFICLFGDNLFGIKRKTIIDCVQRVAFNLHRDINLDLKHDKELLIQVCNSPVIKMKLKKQIALCISNNPYITIKDLSIKLAIEESVIYFLLPVLLESSKIYNENEHLRCMKFSEYLNRLEPENQKIILKRIDGLTYEQIANILNVSRTTIGNRISAILKKAHQYIFYEDRYIIDLDKFNSFNEFNQLTGLNKESYFYLLNQHKI